jgi:hypothetical protein
MKKVILVLVMAFGISSVAHADIFAPRQGRQVIPQEQNRNLQASYQPTPDDVLQVVTNFLGYASPKEGVFYDINRERFENYLAATLYTEPNTNLSLNLGIIDTHSVGMDVSWNFGACLPVEDVPIAKYLQYGYVGFGTSWRVADRDEEDDFGYGPTAAIKFTF